jgi:hypothetical protein
LQPEVDGKKRSHAKAQRSAKAAKKTKAKPTSLTLFFALFALLRAFA